MSRHTNSKLAFALFTVFLLITITNFSTAPDPSNSDSQVISVIGQRAYRLQQPSQKSPQRIYPSHTIAGMVTRHNRPVRLSLPTPIFDSPQQKNSPLGVLAPQIVQSFEQLGNWYFIHSWIGDVWVKVPQPVLKFGVVSDIHVRALDIKAERKFLAMLNDMEENLQVAALVIVGDLGNGIPADYAALDRLVKEKGPNYPIYYTIGNHEFYQAYQRPGTNIWNPRTFPNGETDQDAVNRFVKFTGRPQVYYDQYIAGYHFIFLGSEKSAITDRRYTDKAFLSEQQLQWLKQKLTEGYVRRKPIFVFLHQPLPNTTSGSSHPFEHSDVVQAQQLKDILKAFPEVIYFSGHTHWQLGLSDQVFKDGFTMVTDSSVSLPRSKTGQAMKEHSEGLIVEVYPGQVVVQGRDFIRQNWVPNSLRIINVS